MSKNIILYTQPGSLSCDRAKNIREDPGALAELQRLGARTTPVTVIDSEVVVGFDRGRIERLLGIA